VDQLVGRLRSRRHPGRRRASAVICREHSAPSGPIRSSCTPRRTCASLPRTRRARPRSSRRRPAGRPRRVGALRRQRQQRPGYGLPRGRAVGSAEGLRRGPATTALSVDATGTPDGTCAVTANGCERSRRVISPALPDEPLPIAFPCAFLEATYCKARPTVRTTGRAASRLPPQRPSPRRTPSSRRRRERDRRGWLQHRAIAQSQSGRDCGARDAAAVAVDGLRRATTEAYTTGTLAGEHVLFVQLDATERRAGPCIELSPPASRSAACRELSRGRSVTRISETSPPAVLLQTMKDRSHDRSCQR